MFVPRGSFCDAGGMSEMSLVEAQLFRLLVGFFGRERVVYSMSARAVCGGVFYHTSSTVDKDFQSWADSARCLFTVVDEDDAPKMVVEFAPDFSHFIEVDQLERQGRMPQLLKDHGVQYLTITGEEMKEILNPNGSLDLVSLLKDRFGIEDDSEEGEE